MDDWVVDTSVFMAVLLSEPYTGHLPAAATWIMSSVNVAEVCTLLTRVSPSVQAAGWLLLNTIRSIELFDEAQARKAGELASLVKNLSLGDRACMALAISLDAEVYTADRAWGGLDVGVAVRLIR